MVRDSSLTGFTLVELVIGMVLMGVIVLAVFSFEVVSKEFFRSAERKSVVSDDSSFVLDHIQKTVWLGGGDSLNPAIIVVDGANPILQVRDTAQNYIGNYTFSFDSWQVVFEKGGVSYTLTNRLYNDMATPFGMVKEEEGVRIDNFTLVYNPAAAYHSRNNPRVNVRGIYFYPYGQT